jgi:hypothetical protein
MDGIRTVVTENSVWKLDVMLKSLRAFPPPLKCPTPLEPGDLYDRSEESGHTGSGGHDA